MKTAPVPANEHKRLKTLHEYGILDTIQEADFDDITRIAAEVCRTPISLVSIIDAHRQWFKSRHGLITSETSRDFAFCAHAISNPEEVFIIPDTSKDERFHDNPLVTGEPHVAFYAGIPLVNPEGYALGTLCVWDIVPKNLDESQVTTLQSLARQVVCQLELKRKIKELNTQQAELKRAYEDLDKFASIASHDLKSPLNNIISLTHLLQEGYGGTLNEEGNEYIQYLNDSSYQLSEMVTGILKYSRSSQMITDQKEDIGIYSIIEEVTELLHVPANATIMFDREDKHIHTSRIALKQILMNLLGNAIKYNDKPKIIIRIEVHEDKTKHTFEIKDNGYGIAEADTARIFELFERVDSKDKSDNSQGIGLSIVKRLVEKMGGEIKVHSVPGAGTTFTFTVPK